MSPSRVTRNLGQVARRVPFGPRSCHPTQPLRAGRQPRVIAAGVAFTVAGALALPATAHAAAYRYWTYWSGAAGTWSFATMGPAQSLPPDGSVEGWRFAVTSESGSPEDAPRVEPSFRAICDGTPAVAGNKRIALVVDFGLADDAPAGEVPGAPVTTCVSIATDATGYQVLRSALEVRVGDNGLVCDIDGYPRSECAAIVENEAPDEDAEAVVSDVVTDAGADPDAPSAADAADSPVPVIVGIAITGALAIAAVVVRRRRT